MSFFNTTNTPEKLFYSLILLALLGLSIVPSTVFAHADLVGPPPDEKPKPEEPDKPECNKPMCCEGGGGMVIYYNGREQFTRTDLFVNGVYPIEINRQYMSQSSYDSALGSGWAFNHDKRLFEYPDQSIVLRYGCGNRARFVNTGGGYQRESAGLLATAVKDPGSGAFTVTYVDGKADIFDNQGRLIQSTDVKGNSLRYTYDPRGKLPLIGSSKYAVDPAKPITIAYIHRLTKIEEWLANGTATGNAVTFAYNDSTGRVTSITGGDGAGDVRTVRYTHDVTDGATEGNLLRVTGLAGINSVYEYNDTDTGLPTGVYRDRHNITSIQHKTGDIPYILTYDDNDRVTSETYGNSKLSFDWSQYPNQTTVTETITDDQGLNIENALTVFEFDLNGKILVKRDALGNETRYVRNSNTQPLTETTYEQQGTAEAPNLVLLKTITRTYNTQGQKLTEATTLENTGEIITTTFTYDGSQKASEITVSSLTPTKQFRTEWSYFYDASGNASTVQEERRYKDDGTYLSTRYTYNANGDVLTTTLPDGHIIVNEYGAAYNGRYVTKTYHQIAGVEVPDLTETYTYDNKGNRNRVIDARGNLVIATSYDSLNRRRSTTNQQGHTTSYTYDARGNLSTITRDRSAPNDQLDITRLTYNGKNLLTQIERTDAAGAFITLKQNTYNSAGQLLTTTNSLSQTNTFNYDLLKRLTGITNYKSESISYTLNALDNRTNETVRDSSNVVVRSSDATFDELNRQLTQIGASNNQTTTYTYDAAGNRISMSDALSRPTQYTYDTLSRLTNVQDANTQNTQYTYHDRGWLQTVTDPRNLVTTYNYNELGQLDNLVSPDTGTTTYTYDLAGNKATKNDARNITASYIYDDLNRLININYPDVTKNVTFTYDQNTFGLGKLTRLLDETGSTDFAYNHWGDLIQESKVINGRPFVTAYTYDTEHRLISTTYPSGRVVTMGTDANQDFSSISSNYQSTTQALLENILYMPFGGVDTADYGNALALNQDYDLDYRLTQQQVGTVYDRTNVYNDANNIIGITNIADNTKSQTFIYDDLDRLTDATGIYGAENFTYDEDGNRKTETKNTTDVSTYNYPADSNKLGNITGVKANGYGYDVNGNTTSKNGMTFTYDNTNRMTQAINGAVTTNYQYDGKGQRVVKNVGGVITLFIFDKEGKLIAESDSAGVVQREYVYFGNRPVALATTVGTPAVFYYHVDHLNTPQALTDQSGAIVWAGDYAAFGEVDLAVSIVENNLRFPGQYFDQETQLHYNYFRDYDPSLGRYITSDPIGLEAGVNTYVYVNQNPYRYFDMYGLCCEEKVVGYSGSCLRRLTSALKQCLNLTGPGSIGDSMIGLACSALPSPKKFMHDGGMCGTIQKSASNMMGGLNGRCAKAFNTQAKKQCTVTECI